VQKFRDILPRPGVCSQREWAERSAIHAVLDLRVALSTSILMNNPAKKKQAAEAACGHFALPAKRPVMLP
jgi:hypothetical protein